MQIDDDYVIFQEYISCSSVSEVCRYVVKKFADESFVPNDIKNEATIRLIAAISYIFFNLKETNISITGAKICMSSDETPKVYLKTAEETEEFRKIEYDIPYEICGFEIDNSCEGTDRYVICSEVIISLLKSNSDSRTWNCDDEVIKVVDEILITDIESFSMYLNTLKMADLANINLNFH